MKWLALFLILTANTSQTPWIKQVTELSTVTATHIVRSTEVGPGTITYSTFAPQAEDVMCEARSVYDPINDKEYAQLFRGFLVFDTRTITGTITSAKLRRKFAYSTPIGEDTYTHEYRAISAAVSAITPDEATFDGGTLAYSESGASFTDPEDLTIPANLINVGGYTVIAIRNPLNDDRPTSGYVGITYFDPSLSKLIVTSRVLRHGWIKKNV